MTSTEPDSSVGPFAVKECALVAIATGKKAQSLREMVDILPTIDSGSIYYHFWGALLRPRFDSPEYNNDFAEWAYHSLRDLTLAERLAVINPTDFPDLENLRHHLIELIEQRMDEVEWLAWIPVHAFQFIRSQIVVLDTRKTIQEPQDLVEVIRTMSLTSVFYHFIDARRRPPESFDDFSIWLAGFGDRYKALCDQLALLDPYFNTLAELREQLAELLGSHLRTVSS
jgi:hypothetical protein